MITLGSWAEKRVTLDQCEATHGPCTGDPIGVRPFRVFSSNTDSIFAAVKNTLAAATALVAASISNDITTCPLSFPRPPPVSGTAHLAMCTSRPFEYSPLRLNHEATNTCWIIELVEGDVGFDEGLGTSDQGHLFCLATDASPKLTPLIHVLTTTIDTHLTEFRQIRPCPGLRIDDKTQFHVALRYASPINPPVVGYLACVQNIVENDNARNMFDKMPKKDVASCKSIHGYVVKRGICGVVSYTLIDMYSKCGALKKATELFLSLEGRDWVAWSTILSATFLTLNDEGNVFRAHKIVSKLIQNNDVIKNFPGAKVASNGFVIWGQGQVNESMIIGEAYNPAIYNNLRFSFLYT